MILFIGVAAIALALVAAIVVVLTGDGDVITDPPPPVTDERATDTSGPDDSGPITSGPTSSDVASETTTEGSSGAIPTPEELSASVVQIQLLLGDQVTCTGSGTILDSDGTVLTNSHVITQSEFCPYDRIGVAITDVPELPPTLLFEADLLVNDPTVDLAVIRIARQLDGTPVTPDFPTVEIGDSDDLSLGDQLDIIGYPGIGGDSVTLTQGTISGFVTIPGLGDRSWFKTDAVIAGGNSGGLAANDVGQIVGIPTIAGTGSGDITDCRVVTDTNNDGQIDDNDTCIPIGGFINGIRPVALALPLIEEAATATPMVLEPPVVTGPETPTPLAFASNAIWATDVIDGLPQDFPVVIPTGTTQLCLTWNYEDVPTGTPYEVVWLVDGVVEPDFGFSGVNDGPDFGAFFACAINDDGLADGEYEVAWFINDGDPVFSHAIYTGSDRQPIEITVINDTETALCVVQQQPIASLTNGINLIDTPIEPGDSFTYGLASGIYDARVIDCDGIVRFEDTVGTDLTQSVPLTIV